MKKLQVITNSIIVMILIALIVVAVPFSTQVRTSANPNVIYNGDINQNKVSFMINVYWGTEYIEDMLDIFDLYNVKTTFFVGGSWFAKNVEIAQEIYKRGHEIGNHGYNHKDHDKINEQQNYDEIHKTHLLVSANLGIEMNLFAPPSGAYNDTTINVATSLNYKTIMWTHDTIDWRDKDTDLIIKRATKNLSNGDLILMHPTKNTLEALSSILAYAENNGFEPTTVSQVVGTIEI
ncbi:MAG: polysaccharide deacetylase family protein [Clostridia bacterium]|nr:polysaccharide deacetylase family protein [Clostridia bacterium]